MSEDNAKHSSVVWFDLPVADLDRAIGFIEKYSEPKYTLSNSTIFVSPYSNTMEALEVVW